jgi:hypothetical protein
MKKKAICNSFDFKHFQNYVKTYDEKKDGLDNPDTILKDMLYGLGISIDKEKYSFYKGFEKFKLWLISFFNNKN